MNKKGSMELSVNAIVILVIAIVMLGLILGFVQSKFSDLDNSLVSEEPAPATATLSDPITVSRPLVVTSNGKDVGVKVSIYNNGVQPVTGIVPNFNCLVEDPANPGSFISGVVLKNIFNAKNINVGQAVLFEGIITMGVGSGKGKYLCTICAYDTSVSLCSVELTATKKFSIEIK